jgi:branched-chain amino acid transport system ATP-binding protein/urea transport system ATP-binding protein
LSARRIHGKNGASPEVDRVVTELGLQTHLRRSVGELAHGQRQIVEIGLVLCQRPKLVLLDEPAAGITGAEADRLVELIHGINQQAAVVVVDHDMNFVRMLGGTVTVLHQGAVLMEGSTDAVLNNAKVREVYIGNRAK